MSECYRIGVGQIVVDNQVISMRTLKFSEPYFAMALLANENPHESEKIEISTADLRRMVHAKVFRPLVKHLQRQCQIAIYVDRGILIVEIKAAKSVKQNGTAELLDGNAVAFDLISQFCSMLEKSAERIHANSIAENPLPFAQLLGINKFVLRMLDALSRAGKDNVHVFCYCHKTTRLPALPRECFTDLLTAQNATTRALSSYIFGVVLISRPDNFILQLEDGTHVVPPMQFLLRDAMMIFETPTLVVGRASLHDDRWHLDDDCRFIQQAVLRPDEA